MGLSTGVTNTNDYILGRGKVLLSPLIDQVRATELGDNTLVNDFEGFLDLGEISAFGISIEQELKEYKSSRAGLKVVVRRTVVQTKISAKWTLNEINQDTRRLFYKGEIATFTQTAQTAQTSDDIVLQENKRWYDIKKTSARVYKLTGNPTGAGGTSGVVIGECTFDLQYGKVFVNKVTALTAGTTLNLTGVAWSAIASTDPFVEVRTLKKSAIRAQILFLGTNAANNDVPEEFFLNRTSLSAEGENELIADDYTGMTITANAESDTVFSTVAPIGYYMTYTLP